MDDMLLRLVGCLLHVHREHGAASYRRAARRAVTAICSVLIEEACGTRKSPVRSGNVVRLPVRRGGRNDDGD